MLQAVTLSCRRGERRLFSVLNVKVEPGTLLAVIGENGSGKTSLLRIFSSLLPPEEGTSVGLRIRDVAERARAAISTKTYHGVQMSCSIGGVAYPGVTAESAPDLVAVVDDALAKARAKGSGHVEII